MTRSGPDLITIKALVELSQTHRQTIHYYLRRGILPPPMRVSRTSALYPKANVELLYLVKIAQEKRRLNLDEIRDLFRDTGYKPHVIRQRLQAEDGSPGSLTVEDLRLRLEPPPPRGWIEEAVKRGLVDSTPGATPTFSTANAELVRGLWEVSRFGVPLATFQAINDRIRLEADREMQQFLNSLREIELAGDAYPRVTRLFEVLERFGTQRWKAALNRLFIQRFQKPFEQFIDSDRHLAFPSETFLAQKGLNREIDRLRAALDDQPKNLELMKQLARAYQLRSDWVRLHDLSREILQREPDFAPAIGYLGHALRFMNRLGDSVAVLEDGIRRTGNPLLKVRLGQSLINLAAQTGDATQFLGALIRRAKLAAEALRESEGNAGLSRNVRGVLAMDSLLLSDPLGWDIPSIADLESLYQDLRHTPTKEVSTLGKISLARARQFATYALYLARQRAGLPGAQKLLDQVLAADPDCRLARRGPAKRKAAR
jgi:DNA-binding transcriptional MerR regulator